MHDVEVRVATRRAENHPQNQDRAVVAGTVYDHTPDVVTTRSSGPLLVAVLDGLGGHLAGDVASDLAAHHLADTDPLSEASSVASLLDDTDAKVHAAANAPTRDGMGTTVALFALGDDADSALIANVGDSCVWRVEPDDLVELTTSDRAFGSTITQCLGANSAGVDPHVRRIPLRGGDRFLLASDGLTDVVATATIASALAGSGGTGVQQLMDTVAAQGPPDDVTIVLLDVLASSSARG